jgi:hypothetical protein
MSVFAPRQTVTCPTSWSVDCQGNEQVIMVIQGQAGGDAFIRALLPVIHLWWSRIPLQVLPDGAFHVLGREA